MFLGAVGPGVTARMVAGCVSAPEPVLSLRAWGCCCSTARLCDLRGRATGSDRATSSRGHTCQNDERNTRDRNLGNFAVSLSNTLGGVTETLGNLVNGIIKAGPGGTVTQDMFNQANEVTPAVDNANG